SREWNELMMTCPPRAAICLAMTLPRPCPEPVTRATFPANGRSARISSTARDGASLALLRDGADGAGERACSTPPSSSGRARPPASRLAPRAGAVRAGAVRPAEERGREPGQLVDRQGKRTKLREIARRLAETIEQGRHDLDPLEGVDPQILVESRFRSQYLPR